MTQELIDQDAYWSCCYCCQVTSVVSDSVQPHRRQPTRLLCPWDSPGKDTRVGCHFLLKCMHACMLSRFSCVWLCLTLWTAAHQAPPSTGFSRQESWSGMPFPSPWILVLVYAKYPFLVVGSRIGLEIPGWVKQRTMEQRGGRNTKRAHTIAVYQLVWKGFNFHNQLAASWTYTVMR